MGSKRKGESVSKSFDDAIEHFGSMAEMAKAIGVSAGHVRRMRVGVYKVRREYADKIEELTEGKIKAVDFSPSEAIYKRNGL